MSEKILAKIKAGEYDRKQLENLFANASRLKNMEVQLAAKDALREVDAKSYTKRFLKPIKDKVAEIATEIARENGWQRFAQNTVGDGVKPGGEMLKGAELAEFYLSYRRPSWKRSSYLAVFQHDEDSPVRYKVRLHDGDEKIVDTSESAVELFKRALEAT